MAIEIEGEVGSGLRGVADGVNATLRQGKTGELMVSSTHGINYEATSRGNIYCVTNQTGVTTQAGLSATTPALTLYNPPDSGVNCVILYAGYVTTVAFAAASVIWLAANTNTVAAPVTGTLATAARNGLLGSGSTGRVQPLLAATLPAVPVGVAILGAGLTGAITTVPGAETRGRYFDGSLIVRPGAAISFQTSTASGANAFFGEIVYEEVPIS